MSPRTSWQAERRMNVWSLGASLLLTACSFGDISIGANPGLRESDAGFGRRDECGNGVDDDGNGLIDDGCPCGPGETQACFGGALGSRETGICSDGVQRCAVAGSAEWGDWGQTRCEGGLLEEGEERCDGMDHDCDGAIDEGCACSPGSVVPCGPTLLVGECRAGTQNCGNDSRWSACNGAVNPRAEICGNGLDEDCDGMADELCGCIPEPERCHDGIDNDCDGEIDELACDPNWSVDDLRIVEVERDGHMLCMRSSVGTIACAGYSEHSLGDGVTENSDAAIVLPGLTQVVELEVGPMNQVCVVLASGEVQCWGLGVRVPTPILGISDAQSVECGYSHCCALLSTGEVQCWGNGQYGLGDGVMSDSGVLRAPVYVQGIMNAVEIVAGYFFSCARTATNEVWCWGLNLHGALGDGVSSHTACGASASYDCAPTPVPVGGITGLVTRMHALFYGACVVSSSGSIECWGAPNSRTTSSTGVPLEEDIERVTNAVELTIGQHHICWLDMSGEVRCLGNDCSCQLGDGLLGESGASADCRRTSYTAGPGTRVVDVGTALQVTGGPNGGAVLTTSGEVRWWGAHLASIDWTTRPDLPTCRASAVALPWPGR